MPVLVFKLGIVPYNLLNIMNQEDKDRLVSLKHLIGPMSSNELRQCASVHAELKDSSFSELLLEYALLLERDSK